MGNIFGVPDDKEKLRRAFKSEEPVLFEKCHEVVEQYVKYTYDNGVRATSSSKCPSGLVMAAPKKGVYMVCKPANFDITSSNPSINDFNSKFKSCTGTSTYIPEPYSGKSFNDLN